MNSSRPQISLSREQIRELDRRAIEDYGIPGLILMENAGRNAARIIRGMYEEATKGRSDEATKGKGACSSGPSSLRRSVAPSLHPFVAIVCGRGNNGGDGFVIARHLANIGIAVELFLACDPAALAGDAATNYAIVQRMSLRRHAFLAANEIHAGKARLLQARIVVDAVLGTGFSGDVRPPLDLVIAAINEAHQPPAARHVVAIDLPSGLDCNTGRPANAVVRADETITFVARKLGFDAPAASDYTGRVFVTYIGAPPRLIDEVLAAGPR